MTGGTQRPNFFTLLGLDPDAPWDEARFHQALAEKRHQWGRQASGILTNPATAAAKQHLRLIPEIERVMGSQHEREGERAAGRADRAARTNRRRAELKRRLEIALDKGFLYDTELEAIKTDYPDHLELLVGEDLGRQLDRVPVRQQPSADARAERLDPATAAVVSSQLEVLDKHTLYDVLHEVDRKVTDKSPLPLLRQAAEALYRQAYQTMTKTPEVSAMQQLAGQAKVIFSTEEQRQRYNTTVRFAPLDQLIQEFEQATRSVRRIDARQAERFLREAHKKGIELGVAHAELRAHFIERHWTVELPPPEVEERIEHLTPCRVCQNLNQPGVEFCAVCGTPVRVACPNCGATLPGGIAACERCGFRIGRAAQVLVLVEDCEAALEEADLPAAARYLRQARGLWKLPPDSEEELAVRIRCCAERLEASRDAIRQDDARAEREARDRLAARQPQKALDALQRTRPGLPHRKKLIDEAMRRLEEAERLCQQALRLADADPGRIDLLNEALRANADHEGARNLLATIPPPPPKDLRAVPNEAEDMVRLSWQPTTLDGVSYVVVRHRGRRAPLSVNDGQRLVTTIKASYDDRRPEIGVPLSYGVFAERGGVLSPTCAEPPAPVFLTAKVEIVAAEARNGMVRLRWRPPRHAKDVLVTREQVAPVPDRPSRRRFRPQPQGSDCLLDNEVSNDVRYRYTLVARFQDGDGQRRSKAERVELTPGPPAPLPGALTVTTHPQLLNRYYRQVLLYAPAPEWGALRVLRCQGRVPFPPGNEVGEAELRRHGRLIEQDPLIDVWFEPGLCHYLPVVVADGRAQVGEPRSYACVDEIDGLSGTVRGDTARIRWTWPPGCDEVMIAFGAAPLPDDPTAAQRTRMVTREEYEHTGWHDLPAGCLRELSVLVAAVVRHQGEEFVSSGVAALVRRRPAATVLKVWYELIPRKRFPNTAAQLHRWTETGQELTLPEMVLVGKRGVPPLERADGVWSYKLPPARIVGDRHDDLPKARAAPLHCRLFPTNDAEDLVLVDPPTEGGLLR